MERKNDEIFKLINTLKLIRNKKEILPIIKFDSNQRIKGESMKFLLSLDRTCIFSSDLISVDKNVGLGKSGYDIYFETSLFDYPDDFGRKLENLNSLYIYNTYVKLVSGMPVANLPVTIWLIKDNERKDIITYFSYIYKKNSGDAKVDIWKFIENYKGNEYFESFSSDKGVLIIALADYFNLDYMTVINDLRKFYDYRRGEKFPYPKEYIIDDSLLDTDKEDGLPDFTTKLIVPERVKNVTFKERPLVNLDVELLNVTELEENFRSNLISINKLTVSPKLKTILFDLFSNRLALSNNFELELQSSFFLLVNENKNLAQFYYYDSHIFMHIKRITIFNEEINQEMTLDDLFEIQMDEASKLITYVLNKFNCKYANKFFKKYDLQDLIYRKEYLHSTSKKIFNDPRRKIKLALSSFLITHLSSKDAMHLIKTGSMDIIESYIDEFYKEKYGIKEKKEDKKIVLIQNNELEGKTVKEVYAILNNMNISKIEKIDINTFLNYGNEFDKFLDYITNGYANAISKKSTNDEYIKDLKNYLNKIKMNKKLTLNMELINMVNDFTSKTCISVREEMLSLKDFNELMLLYINKLSELINYLESLKNDNDNLTNVFITSKIDGFETIRNTMIEEYKQISLMVASDFNFQNSLDVIKKTYIPRLLINMNSMDDFNNKKLIMNTIKDINEVLDEDDIKKNKR